MPGSQSESDPTAPANWREALLALLASRVTLIELEAKDAIQQAVCRLMRLLAFCLCALFLWALLLVGAIGWLAHASGWPWYGIALGFAALHLLAALLLARTTQTSSSPAFPVTRSEFNKDREWIHNLQKNPKSNT